MVLDTLCGYLSMEHITLDIHHAKHPYSFDHSFNCIFLFCFWYLQFARDCPKVLEDTVLNMTENVHELLMKLTFLSREKDNEIVTN